jgi:DNA-binding CsgD family transcriptional regulator
MLGELNAAREALKRREALPPFGFLGPEQELARAWTLAVAGEKVAAEECFLNAADLAAGTGHRTSEAWILHDLLRACGRNESHRLAVLAEKTDSALVRARADHAVARRAGGADGLVQAAEQFLGLGARLLSAEALTSAADAHRRAGRQRRATEVGQRASALAAGCEGARTPDLMLADTVTPLSKRERDVARLAATGLQSKEIAARLSLSVRTVDNYLQRAYAKLGVTNRGDLATALTATP